MTDSVIVTSSRCVGGASSPPPLLWKIRSLRMRCPTRPGMVATSSWARRSCSPAPDGVAPYRGRKPPLPHAASIGARARTSASPRSRLRRATNLWRLMVTRAGPVSANDIHDPLRHHNHLLDRPAGQRTHHRFQLERRCLDLVLGRSAGDRKLVSPLAIYLYGNGNHIVNEQRLVQPAARADRQAGCCIQAAPSSLPPNAAALGRWSAPAARRPRGWPSRGPPRTCPAPPTGRGSAHRSGPPPRCSAGPRCSGQRCSASCGRRAAGQWPRARRRGVSPFLAIFALGHLVDQPGRCAAPAGRRRRRRPRSR